MGSGSLNGEADFARKLAFSRGRTENTHPETIRKLIVGCESVRTVNINGDDNGIDFVATLRRGAELNIDLKAREPCSRYWAERNEPELALETWSVCQDERHPKGRTGWTLDESKLTDYTLHVFDPADTTEVFLLPFQLLRMAFHRNLFGWRSKFRERKNRKRNESWDSAFIPVPAWCVIGAIEAEMRPVFRVIPPDPEMDATKHEPPFSTSAEPELKQGFIPGWFDQ